MQRTLRERFGALRNLPPFLRLIWQTSRSLTLGNAALRLLRAVLPVAMLFLGKLIIDEVIILAGQGGATWASGKLDLLAMLIALELAIAVLSDVVGRVVSLLDALLSERFTNETSIRLMEHAATLDLEDFEDSELQDQLERARRQTMGRSSLLTQILGQAQDVVTILTFAAGLVAYAPWLILLLAIALIPAFLGEAHFNAASYTLNYMRTPERRELDYVRQTGAGVETASSPSSPPSARSATTSRTPISPGARCAASSPATSPSSPAPSADCARCSKDCSAASRRWPDRRFISTTSFHFS